MTRFPALSSLAVLRRRWKDWTLAALAVAVVVLASLLIFGGPLRSGAAGAGDGAPPGAADASGLTPVEVFDVALDRDAQRSIEILFDRPVVGDDARGEILTRPPATLSPAVGGTWTWRESGILRFDASGRLPLATEFTVSLIPVRFEALGKRLAGETEFAVRTDAFLVERLEVVEEPAPDAPGKVRLRGTIRFSHPVEPGELATRLALEDPAAAAAGGAPPAVELEAGWRSTAIPFRTTPLAKRKEARTLVLRIDAALTPAEGNLPLGRAFEQAVELGSSETLAVRDFRVEPGPDETRLLLTLSSPVAAAVARPHVAVEPAVDFRLSAAGNALTLRGPFEPGADYALTLAAGLPARDDASLPQVWKREFRVPDLAPSIDFKSPGMFLPRTAESGIALEAVNVTKARFVVERVYRNNLFHMFHTLGFPSGGSAYRGWGVGRELGDRLVDETLEIDGARNRRRVVAVDVAAKVADAEPGLYRLAVHREGEWQAAQRLLLRTDLGLVGKRTTGGFLLWVTSVRTLAPVAGARVTLLDRQNQTLAEGRTGADGLWRVDDLPGGEGGEDGGDGGSAPEPYLALVERGEDFSFLLLDRMGVDTAGLDVGGAPPGAGGYRAFLYGERDLYRPGETVEGVALLRDDALQAPPAMPVVLRHRDPTGVERDSLVRTTDAAGVAEFALDLPDHALTGGHALELTVAERTVATYRFQVEEFVPDRIEVEVAPEAEPVEAGEPLRFRVQADYLFGAPGAGLPLEARVRLAGSRFVPPGHEGFAFHDPERALETREIFSEEGALDAEGAASFTVPVAPGDDAPAVLEATIVARVSERGGRGVTAARRVRVHPYPYLLGLRRDGEGEGHVEPGRAARFAWVAARPDGTAVEQGGLRAELYRDRWQTVLRRLPSGNFRYESTREEELLDSHAVAGGAARGTFEFTVSEPGSYRVRLTDATTGAATQVGFWASGWGYAPWAVENPARIELELDREEYRPGDTASVLVRAPFGGRLLLTVERDGIHHLSVHELESNTATVRVPVAAALRPNAYVTATLVRRWDGLEPGAVGRAFGAVPIRVDRAANRIDVAVEAPERVRSESTLAVAVRAAPGAVVTVAAVDEGILQLVAQATPDPFEHFYRKRALSTRTFDTYQLLLPPAPLEDAAAPGGGDGGAGVAQYLATEPIRRARPVAYWSGALRADRDGRVRVEIDVPEFQGALRVMAVAADGRRFGSADRRVQVRDPIVVTPTWPRFLSFEETAVVPVVVRNDTGARAEIRVALAVEGAAALAPGTAPQRTVTLDQGAETTVDFAVATGAETGAVAFEARAMSVGETAAASVSVRATAEVPVRADLPRQTRRVSGAVGERVLELQPDVAWARPGTGRLALRVGPTPLAQFAGELSDLLRYPYGCLEQTVSRAFPLIDLEDVAARLAPDLFGDGPGARSESPAQLVQEAVRRVEGFRLESGAFPSWPGGREVDDWASLWATHFLGEARRAGYSVDDFALDAALGHVGRIVVAKPRYGADERRRVLYGAWILAQADRVDRGTLAFLRDKQGADLAADERAMLAAAFAHAGDAVAAERLLAQIAEVEAVERRLGANLDSTLRNRALATMALLDARPDDPRLPARIDRLTREAAALSRWNTQEQAWTFLALGRFHRRQAERGPYSGRVLAGGKEVGRFGAEPATFDDLPWGEPLRIEMDAGYTAGAAFYDLTARAVPRDDAWSATSEGLTIARAWFDRDGGAIDPSRIRLGDLVVMKTSVASRTGPVENAVVSLLLPSGLEVENPRLETTETLPWVDAQPGTVEHVDVRDDRVLLFLDVPGGPGSPGGAAQPRVAYTLLRAVGRGEFRLPPAQVEAMYDGSLRAATARGSLTVTARDAAAGGAAGGAAR